MSSSNKKHYIDGPISHVSSLKLLMNTVDAAFSRLQYFEFSLGSTIGLMTTKEQFRRPERQRSRAA